MAQTAESVQTVFKEACGQMSLGTESSTSRNNEGLGKSGGRKEDEPYEDPATQVLLKHFLSPSKWPMRCYNSALRTWTLESECLGSDLSCQLLAVPFESYLNYFISLLCFHLCQMQNEDNNSSYLYRVDVRIK